MIMSAFSSPIARITVCGPVRGWTDVEVLLLAYQLY